MQANSELPSERFPDLVGKISLCDATSHRWLRRVRPNFADMSLGKEVGRVWQPSARISYTDVLRLGIRLQIPRLIARGIDVRPTKGETPFARELQNV